GRREYRRQVDEGKLDVQRGAFRAEDPHSTELRVVDPDGTVRTRGIRRGPGGRVGEQRELLPFLAWGCLVGFAVGRINEQRAAVRQRGPVVDEGELESCGHPLYLERIRLHPVEVASQSGLQDDRAARGGGHAT